jgi:prepilin-type N-terminal cleavage/methylation domain-containing protein
MSHVNNLPQKGFTLIELLLAMTFISMLLLAIALTILQISSIYNRGMIVKEVNQIGRTVTSELQKEITSTVPFPVDQAAGSHYFQQGTSGGRLCLGQYSYLWNYGSAITPGTSSTRNLYTGEALLVTAQSSPIRLVKVYDTNASYCNNLNQTIDPTSATEMLSIGDHQLALHDFTVTTSTTADDARTGQRLYTITFVVGTNEQAALTGSGTNTTCKAPGTVGADLSYCVVQKFTIAVRAGNMVQ